jgi:hypothetical protein
VARVRRELDLAPAPSAVPDDEDAPGDGGPRGAQNQPGTRG